jgi:predicted dehydrogenase
MSSTVKVALLGCGALAEILAERVYPRVRDRLEVVAAVDISLDRANAIGEKLGARAFATVNDAAEALELEAVDVRLPHHLHLAGAELAAAQDLPFLIEKPMASTLGEAKEIAALADRVKGVCGVSENYGYLAPVRAARDLLQAGAIGELLVAQSTRVFELGPEWHRDGWRVSQSGPQGVLIDQGPHVARLVRTVLGEVEEVCAYAGAHREGFSSTDSVVVAARMRSGHLVSQLLTWACPSPAAPDDTPELALYGSGGSISVYISYDGEGGGALLQRPEAPDEWHGGGTHYYDSLAGVLDDWAASLRGGGQPSCSISEGIADMEVVEAIRGSSATGAPVTVTGDPRQR